MAEPDDRERLRELTKQKQQAKQAAEAERQRQEAEKVRKEAEERAADERKTQEILAYCTKTLVGHKLEQTNHELQVMRGPSARNLGGSCGIQDNYGIPYVLVYVKHVGVDIMADIPLLATRCLAGRYEVTETERGYSFDSLDKLRDKVLDLVAGMDQDYMKKVLDKIRSLRR